MLTVLIAGAGIAGLSTAYVLARAGHQVTIVERAESLRDEGYMMDFYGAGYDAAERLGLLPELAQIHYPIARLSFLDKHGRQQVSAPYPTLRQLFRGRHFNFMRGDFEHLLYAKVRDRAELRFGTTVSHVEQDERALRATLSDGTRASFDLLVGADGIHSPLRARLFGPERQFLRPLGYYAAAYIIDEPPQGYDQGDAFATLTDDHQRQVAVYPISGGRLATFLLYRSDQETADLAGAQARAKLRAVFEGMGWFVPAILERCPADRLYYDTVAQIELPRWSRGRATLVGDACQCVSPIAGQGASMALAGAYALGEALGDGRAEIGRALNIYEQQMRPGVEQVQRSGRKLAPWFVPSSRLRVRARNLIVRAISMPLVASRLRQFFASESAIKL